MPGTLESPVQSSCGEDQHVGVRVLDDIEGHVLGGLAAAGEPVLDGVALAQPGISPRR